MSVCFVDQPAKASLYTVVSLVAGSVTVAAQVGTPPWTRVSYAEVIQTSGSMPAAKLTLLAVKVTLGNFSTATASALAVFRS